MKQRIRVAGIIKKEDGFLFLKKNMGRMESGVVWEIPTGKINFGEQPEEAIFRVIYDYLGVMVSSVKIIDAITFTVLQGASQLYNLYIIFEVKLSEGQKIVPSEKYTAFKFVKYGTDTYKSMMIENASSAMIELLEANSANSKNFSSQATAYGATIYTDGGSRGNPGPSGIGYYVISPEGKELKRGGEFIGFATSRVAEYYGLKEGIEQAIELGLKSVRFMSDSLMMVNQMNGIYKIKNRDLVPLYNDIHKMLTWFDSVSFMHVNREQNIEADSEVNKAINRHFGIDEQAPIGHEDS